MTANICVHIGIPKTGSTYLQSALAINHDVLAKANMVYPNPDLQTAASRGWNSPGNVQAWSQIADWLDHAPDDRTGVFSAEKLAEDLVDPENQAVLKHLTARKHKLRVLLFVRDPLDHATSLWQQHLKGGRTSQDINDFLERYDTLAELIQTLDALARVDCETTIHNYSRCSKQILSCLQGFLGCCALQPPVQAQINRSMTGAERTVLRLLTDFVGPLATTITATLWCNYTAGIQSEPPEIAPAALDAFQRRLAPLVAEINRRVPAAAALRMPPAAPTHAPGGGAPEAPPPADALTFTGAQIRVLVAAIGEILRRTRLTSDEATQLHAIAQRCAARGDRQDARSLLQMALKIRPQDPALQAQLAAWTHGSEQGPAPTQKTDSPDGVMPEDRPPGP